MRHVVIDSGGNIINAVEWNGTSPWTPPIGTTAIQNNVMQIGGTYISGIYTPPPPPPSTMP